MKYNTEQEFLENGYNANQYERPNGYTSDIAIFTIVSEDVPSHEKRVPKHTLKLLLIQRALQDDKGNPNIEGGKWALPGGFVDADETGHEAALRELEEETNLADIFVKHIGMYDKRWRDPRGNGWTISNANYAIVPEKVLEKRMAKDDAMAVELYTMEEVFQLELAFDHKTIIEDALHMVEQDMFRTTVAKNFLPKEFTISELREVLLAVKKESSILIKANFFRKAPNLPFIEEVKAEENAVKTTTRNSKRPSKLYHFNDFEPFVSIY